MQLAGIIGPAATIYGLAMPPLGLINENIATMPLMQALMQAGRWLNMLQAIWHSLHGSSSKLRLQQPRRHHMSQIPSRGISGHCHR